MTNTATLYLLRQSCLFTECCYSNTYTQPATSHTLLYKGRGESLPQNRPRTKFKLHSSETAANGGFVMTATKLASDWLLHTLRT